MTSDNQHEHGLERLRWSKAKAEPQDGGSGHEAGRKWANLIEGSDDGLPEAFNQGRIAAVVKSMRRRAYELLDSEERSLLEQGARELERVANKLERVEEDTWMYVQKTAPLVLDDPYEGFEPDGDLKHDICVVLGVF